MAPSNLPLYFVGIAACLISKSAGREAIVGGDKAAEDQFPYQVALMDSVHGQFCGGGIIGEQFVLTAAHCVIQPDSRFRGTPIAVLAATVNVCSVSKTAVQIMVKKIYVPREFSSRTPGMPHDLAVLKLDEPFKLSKHIKKLQLPKAKDEQLTGKVATIAGFGWDKIKTEDGRTVVDIPNAQLLYGQAQILDTSGSEFSEKHILAKMSQRPHQDRGACLGDSGGPLVHENIVVGVFSLSPKECVETTKPAVYTRVSHYLDFIHEAIKDEHNWYIRQYVLIA